MSPPLSARTIASMPAASSALFARSASGRLPNDRTTTSCTSLMIPSRSSDLDYFDELSHRRSRFLERGVFVRRELDLDDLLEPARAELAGYADEEIAHAVLALQKHRTRYDLVLVEEDCLDHINHRRAGRVPCARSDELCDLGAAASRPRDDAIDRRLVHEIGNRNARHRRIPRQRHHRITVAAEHERVHVLDRHIQF